MYLLIDCGNTRIKWAFAGADTALAAWHAQGALLHAELEQMGALLAAQMQTLVPSGLPLRAVWLANVAGKALQDGIYAQVERAHHARGALNWQLFQSREQAAGLRNTYRNPQQLGCDRFAAMLGAASLEAARPLLVVNCGTATTIDAINREQEFIGGMIAPGLVMMAQALARNTAQLPQIQELTQQAAHGHSPAALQQPPALGLHTEDAILRGCLQAQCGAIEKTWHDLQRSTQQTPSCILSGGAAFALSPGLSIPHRILDNLVLTGLHAFLRAEPLP